MTMQQLLWQGVQELNNKAGAGSAAGCQVSASGGISSGILASFLALEGQGAGEG